MPIAGADASPAAPMTTEIVRRRADIPLPRMTFSVAVWLGAMPVIMRVIAAAPSTASPLIAVTMSPTIIPACSAGPPGLTIPTIAPPDRGASASPRPINPLARD